MNKSISTPAIPRVEDCVQFSFEYLQIIHPKFPISDCGADFFCSLFEQILRYQKTPMHMFTDSNHQKDHRYPIDFKATTEPEGFAHIEHEDDENLWVDTGWQFALPDPNGDKRWRVHGFIDEKKAMFYVVWFDPYHRLFT